MVASSSLSQIFERRLPITGRPIFLRELWNAFFFPPFVFFAKPRIDRNNFATPRNLELDDEDLLYDVTILIDIPPVSVHYLFISHKMLRYTEKGSLSFRAQKWDAYRLLKSAKRTHFLTLFVNLRPPSSAFGFSSPYDNCSPVKYRAPIETFVSGWRFAARKSHQFPRPTSVNSARRNHRVDIYIPTNQNAIK